jgi:hypothetical protein
MRRNLTLTEVVDAGCFAFDTEDPVCVFVPNAGFCLIKTAVRLTITEAQAHLEDSDLFGSSHKTLTIGDDMSEDDGCSIFSVVQGFHFDDCGDIVHCDQGKRTWSHVGGCRCALCEEDADDD